MIMCLHSFFFFFFERVHAVALHEYVYSFAVACKKNAAVFVVVTLPERRGDMIIIFIRS